MNWGQFKTTLLFLFSERPGFEPGKAFDLTRLPIVHLRPLGHLSNNRLKYIRNLKVGLQTSFSML